MIHKRFRVQVVVRLLLIIAVALLLAYLIGWTTFYEAYVLVGGVLVYLCVSLIRYVEKTTRDLTRFLEAIRYADFSQGYASGERGPLFEQLSAQFDEVVAEFKRIRAEKQEQVQYLKNVVRHIGIALIAFREDGQVEFVNAAAKRLLDVHNVRHIGELKSFSDELVGTMRTIPTGQRMLVQPERNGERLQLAVYATRFSLRGTTHTLVSIQDIRDELEEREMQAWQQLTRVLTHEIMNSVAPISSLASTAGNLLDGDSFEQDSASAQDAKEALEVIERRSESLINFVDAYRSFTKIDPPNFELFPVRQLFDRVSRLLSGQAESVQVSTHIEPENLNLTADPDLVEQVLINLVLNAIQAVESQPDARVELHASVGRNGIPEIRVADNGPGIPPDVRERIFVPFFTTKDDGSGIGLSLARQIMRLHGGSISVQSSDKGATFTLRF